MPAVGRFLALAALLGLAAGCKDATKPLPRTFISTARINPASQAPLPDPDVVVPAQRLAQEYRKDPAAADAKYKDKVVRMEGAIHAVLLTEIPGESTVALEGYRDKDNEIPTLIQCGIMETRAGPLYDLKLKQNVTVQGRCIGSFATTVLVRDGIVVK
jgi:hypothetical protein